jgi:hypothetical protein
MDNNKIISIDASVEEQLRHKVELLQEKLYEAQRDIKADDHRVLPLLREMYDTMVNHHNAELWSDFVSDIANMPDLSTRKYSGTVTLTFSFYEVEIPGDIADWEIEEKILEAMGNDLSYGYEEQVEVDYQED